MGPIVGIGELLWDIYPDGRKVAGGAPFNFAFHCHQLGHEGVIVSRVGDDDLGRELREEVKRRGMSDEFIQTDHEHQTGTVRVTIDLDGSPTYRIADDVAWDYIGEGANLRLADVVDTVRLEAVCFGSLALRRPTSATTVFAFLAGSKALRVFDVNLREDWYRPATIDRSLRVSDWVKMNAEELAVLTGMLDLPSDDDGLVATFDLLEQYSESNPDGDGSLKTVMVTRGIQG